MQTYSEYIDIESTDKTDFIDVTSEVKAIVKKSGISEGIANIYTKHTTTAIRINENEPRLMRDIKEFLEKNAPQYRCYKHDDIDKRDVPEDEPRNAHSHLKSLFMGASEAIPIIGNELVFGQWQCIFFVDLDGPRARQMLVHIIGK